MSGMTTYFIRRLLLVPITFLVITFMVYSILRLVPGGPIEQAETDMKLSAASGEGGGGGGGGLGDEAGLQLDEEAMEELKEYFSLDKPVPVGYAQWLGVWPRNIKHRVPVVPAANLEKTEEALAETRRGIESATARLAGASGDERAELEETLRRAERKEAVLEKDLERATELSPLFEARQTHEEAAAALAAHLEGLGLTERIGRFWRPIEDSEVPEDVRLEAGRLFARTFGERYPLREYLDPQDLVFDGERFYGPPNAETPAEGLAEAETLRAAMHAARKKLEATEKDLGYFVNAESGKLTQVAFRPLLELNRIRTEAGERLDAHFEAEGHVAYQGRFFVKLTEDERSDESKKPMFERAEKLAKKFGKRDDLLAYLVEKGYTWRKEEYYRFVRPEEMEKKEEYFDTARALLAAGDLAHQKLRQVEEERQFHITDDGRMYTVESAVSGILELDFGQSYTYSEPVLGLIGSKMEVSIQFGLIGYFLTWLVCVPLGVFKAIHHRTWFDSISSVLVFIGYSIPPFVLCLILLSTLAVNIEWLPLGGYKPPNIEEMSWGEAVVGRIQHMLIPIAGYMIGSFAAMTILMKNSLLENLGQDYVRTAFAKGLREKRVIFVHALRNSLIPITAGIGHALGLLFAGSFLIEKTCNIDGMGLLGFHAILQRDYPIILGLLVLLVLIRLTGNIFSDIIWALIDPRIRFGK